MVKVELHSTPEMIRIIVEVWDNAEYEYRLFSPMIQLDLI